MAFMNADAAERADNAQINITPLVDVMLVLLIIFLVAAPAVVKQIEMPLLPGPPSATNVEPPVISLQIESSGTLQFEGRTLSLGALERIFQVESARPEMPMVKIEVAPEAAYVRMTEVLALTRTYGLNRLELQTH